MDSTPAHGQPLDEHSNTFIHTPPLHNLTFILSLCLILTSILLLITYYSTQTSPQCSRRSSGSPQQLPTQHITQYLQTAIHSLHKSYQSRDHLLIISLDCSPPETIHPLSITSLLVPKRIITTHPIHIGNKVWITKARQLHRHLGGAPPLRSRNILQDILENPITRKFTSANNTHT